MPRRVPWQKLLYVKQDYPDNYVDDTFLEELQKNANIRKYEYWSVVLESTIITQHISSIVIFVAVFIYLYQEQLSPHVLIGIGAAGTALGYVFVDLTNSILSTESNFQRRKIFKGAVFIFLTLLVLTPMLSTLTLTTTKDTIWALSAILFIANLAFHDYDSDRHLRTTEHNVDPGLSVGRNQAFFVNLVSGGRSLSLGKIHGPWDEARPKIQDTRTVSSNLG
ncbi:hypothetical protein BGZ68_009845 [Mortierella alpina]|nr:hypothetical protein BGZ68_009845 [Mortierella alpina]